MTCHVRSPRFPALLTWLAAFILAGAAGAQEKASFRPTGALDLRTLGEWVARRSSRVQGDLVALDAAQTEVAQARLYGNPQLDGSWATIPVGPTNPEGVSSRLTSIPSYGLGISYTFLIGKRGPRQRRAAATVDSDRATVAATTRAQALELARLLGEMAVASLRVAGLSELVEQQKGSITLAETRVTAGLGTPLDVDRLQIERSRTEQQVLSNEIDLRRAQAACSALLALRCETFADTDAARTYLAAWTRRAEIATPAFERRPDLVALDAARRAALADADLAAATAIPDPTVRLGYLYDQFTLAGNQRHSVNLTVSIPLPSFDTGAVQRSGALVHEARLSAQRSRLVAGAEARVASLREVLASQKGRRDMLLRDMLPKARLVVLDLEKAANARLIPLTDVIQARRTLNELLVQEAETQGDAFETSLDLLAETSSEADASGPRAP